MIALLKRTTRAPSAVSTRRVLAEVNLPSPITVLTLRCFARPVRPPVRRLTTPSFQPRMAAGSKVGAPKLTPCEPIALASSMTLATCSSALDGMQPTLRQTPPSVGRDVDQNDVLPQIGGAEGGGVAAGTGAQNQDIGLEIGLPARVGSGLRRWTRGRGGLGSGLLDFDAAAPGAGGRRGGSDVSRGRPSPPE